MFKKTLSTVFLILGVFFIFQGLFDISKRLGFYKVSPNFSQTNVEYTKTETSSVPVKISISSIALNLPIESTLIENGTWPTSQFGVSFLKNSGTVGLPGNLILYGHNWKTILGNLKNANVGDEVIVQNSSGQEFFYNIAYIATVSSDNVSILADSTDERLTLYTCTGLLDQKRLVVVAKRV